MKKDKYQEKPDIEVYRKHLHDSLLGQLRLKVFELVAKSPDRIPTASEMKRFMLRLHRHQPEYAKILLFLGTVAEAHRFSQNHLSEKIDISALRIMLEQNPWSGPMFLELADCPAPFPKDLGILIFCEALQCGGQVYIVNIISLESFPHHIFGRLEVRAVNSVPEPFVSLFDGKTYKPFSLKNWYTHPVVKLSVRCLNALNNARLSTRISVDKAVARGLTFSPFSPPIDPHCNEIIKQVYLGHLKCLRTRLPIIHIQPYNFSFCMLYPLELVESVVQGIVAGEEPALVVYWDGANYVMSDDYPAFLAYRALGRQDVPAVIMGQLPPNVSGEFGGAELLPDLYARTLPDYDSLSAEVREWMLNKRLRNIFFSSPDSKIYAIILQFHMLLLNPSTTERQIHDLLQNYPLILDPAGIKMLSEVRLGNRYRVDFIVQYDQNDRRIVLVELEKSSLAIFTKKGRLLSHVVHAIQQVEDWLRWWHEHHLEIPNTLDSTVPPEGLVVIGRSINLEKDERRRLFHLNANRRVKVITYDDLSDRLENIVVTSTGNNR